MKIIFSVILFMIFYRSDAQLLELRSLIKGQKVPNILLSLHTGDSVNSINLYDLNKKLIIFDFWGTYCSSCIANMPHLQKLQEEFGNNIQIIIVTKNSKKEVDNLFARINGHVSSEITYAWKHLPFIVEDSILDKLFPHDAVPCHVWLNSTKVVEGIAYDNTTTSENIQAFLMGKKIKLAKFGMAEIDPLHPLSWINGEDEFINQLKYYSFIYSRLNHQGGGDGQVAALIDSTTKKIVGFSCINMSIADLYKLSRFHYKNPNIGIPDNKILLEVKNKDKFYPPKNTEYLEWADTSLFTYAIRVPLKKANDLYIIMRQDLDRYFHYNSKLENRKVKCLILKRITKKDTTFTKGREAKYEIDFGSNGARLNIQNTPISILVSRIETVVSYKDSFMPFFDETQYQGNIDINIPWSDEFKDISISGLRKSLRKYGLDLVEEYKILSMLVISDEKLKQ
jgi:thiol-disulfide isomerase/thioredoxin